MARLDWRARLGRELSGGRQVRGICAAILWLTSVSACTGAIRSVEENVEPTGIDPIGIDPIGIDPTAIDPTVPCSQGTIVSVPVRRLSRVEYRRTVEDLLPSIDVPDLQIARDPRVHGFENNAASLNPSTILVEQYNDIAVLLAERTAVSRGDVLSCTPQGDDLACARKFIEEFGARAFRRPLADAEVHRYFEFFEARMHEISWNGAFELTMQAFLQAPQFTYRLEFGESDNVGSGDTVPLTQHELGSRLSYFLWQSMPDAELMRAAGAGELATPQQIEAQARRMLGDTRGEQAVVDFHRQWLDFDRLLTQNKDADLFPVWNDNLRDSLYEEAQRMVAHVWSQGDGTLGELLTSNVGYVNGPVAELYGVSGVAGAAFQQITLPASERSGILSRGFFVASRAHSTNGSPPLRGVAVLDRLLCTPPNPPPAGADTSTPLNDEAMPRTNRELFEERTAVSPCNGCHRTIDGIGFGFEAYDSIGRFRTQDHGHPVDASGELLGTDVDGEFTGAVELGARLANSDQVQECFVRNWYRYAHGRDDLDADRCKLDDLAASMRESGGDIRELIVAVTMSHEFGRRAAKE